MTVPFNPFFLHTVQAGQVKSISTKGDTVQGTFTTKLRYPASRQEGDAHEAVRDRDPDFWNDAQLSALLQGKGRPDQRQVDDHEPVRCSRELLLGFGPTLLIVGLFVLIARRAAKARRRAWARSATSGARRRGASIRKRSA